jgi:hypothetical protein
VESNPIARTYALVDMASSTRRRTPRSSVFKAHRINAKTERIKIMKKKTSKPSAEHLKADRVNVLNSAFDEMIKTIGASMRISPIVFFEGNTAVPGEYIFREERSGQPYRFS